MEVFLGHCPDSVHFTNTSIIGDFWIKVGLHTSFQKVKPQNYYLKLCRCILDNVRGVNTPVFH